MAPNGLDVSPGTEPRHHRVLARLLGNTLNEVLEFPQVGVGLAGYGAAHKRQKEAKQGPSPGPASANSHQRAALGWR